MILKPLQRIQVLESTKKYKPGSLGYFVAQDSVNSYNGWDMCIVFTRFGKKGKARIELTSMRAHMIDYATMKDSDRRIIDITRLREAIEPAQYTDRKGRICGTIGEIKIEPFPIESKNLLDLPDGEFTAYIIALSLFIHKMTYNKRVCNLISIPGIRQRDFVESNFSLMTADPESIGYYILYGIYYDEWTKKKHLVNRRSFKESYSSQILTQSRKRGILSRLHKSLAMAKDPIKRYKTVTEDVFIINSVKINNVLKYYRAHKKELNQIEERDKKSQSGHTWGDYVVPKHEEVEKYEEVEVDPDQVEVASPIRKLFL